VIDVMTANNTKRSKASQLRFDGEITGLERTVKFNSFNCLPLRSPGRRNTNRSHPKFKGSHSLSNC
ncbi:unnamed protein product, partial [Nesidiocoris tenuis]